MVNKGQDHVTEKQQPFALAGVGNIGKLMGRDVELFCEDLPVSCRLIQHDDHVTVLENILDFTGRKEVFHVLGQPRGNTAPLTETLPNLDGISGSLLLFQKQVHLIHIISGGLAAAAVGCDTPPDLILDDEHSELLHLLAQFLDVVADDAVVDVHIGAVVEQIQTALDVDLGQRIREQRRKKAGQWINWPRKQICL